jgi:hypothetical protein
MTNEQAHEVSPESKSIANTKKLSVNFVIPDKEVLNNQYKNPERCPIEFYFDKDSSGKNVLSCHIVNVNGANREILEKTMQDLTGIVDTGLAFKLLTLAHSAMPGAPEEGLSLILQALNNCKPKNSIEAGLIAQATILEFQGMSYLARAEIQDMIPQKEFFLNAATKLLRLHHETLEALNRQRRGNEQKIVVQHQSVQVNEGGQAVVGNIVAGGRGSN